MMRWNDKGLLNYLLLPFSVVFLSVVWFRRFLYKTGVFKRHHLQVPVIVVGNITVGGAGKTPLTIFLATFLKERGFHPGILSRGYKGSTQQFPQFVNSNSDPKAVGDEPVLMAARTGLPVVVDPKRPRGAQHLLANTECDLILCDDGLQHYALARDLEISVIDGHYRFGNGYRLPAGPLREPISRLNAVDLKVAKQVAAVDEYPMEYLVRNIYLLTHPSQKNILEDLRGKRYHAVAGIARPDSFFSLLRQYGIEMIEHAFPDHYDYSKADFSFGDSLPILMTEKDAVKCKKFADERFWVVSVDAKLPEDFNEALLRLLQSVITNKDQRYEKNNHCLLD